MLNHELIGVYHSYPHGVPTLRFYRAATDSPYLDVLLADPLGVCARLPRRLSNYGNRQRSARRGGGGG